MFIKSFTVTAICFIFSVLLCAQPKSEITLTGSNNNIVTVVQGGQITNYNTTDKAQLAKLINYLKDLPGLTKDTKLILQQENNINSYLKLIFDQMNKQGNTSLDQLQMDINSEYLNFKEHLVYNLFDTVLVVDSKIKADDDDAQYYKRIYPLTAGGISKLDMSKDFRIDAECEISNVLDAATIDLLSKYGRFKKGSREDMDNFVPFDSIKFSKISDSFAKEIRFNLFCWNVQRTIDNDSKDKGVEIDQFFGISLNYINLNFQGNDSISLIGVTPKGGWGEEFKVNRNDNILKISVSKEGKYYSISIDGTEVERGIIDENSWDSAEIGLITMGKRSKIKIKSLLISQ